MTNYLRKSTLRRSDLGLWCNSVVEYLLPIINEALGPILKTRKFLTQRFKSWSIGSNDSRPVVKQNIMAGSVAGVCWLRYRTLRPLAGSNILLCQHRLSGLLSKGGALRTKGSHLLSPCKQVTEAKSKV
jgi:hypothetical protein